MAGISKIYINGKLVKGFKSGGKHEAPVRERYLEVDPKQLFLTNENNNTDQATVTSNTAWKAE